MPGLKLIHVSKRGQWSQDMNSHSIWSPYPRDNNSSCFSNWMYTVNIWIACYKTNEIFLMWDRFPNNLSSPMSHQGDKDLCCGKPLPYSVFIVCVLDIWSSWISNWMFTVNIWIACYKTNEIFLMWDRFPNNLSSPMSHQGDKDLCCGKPLPYSVFIVCVLDIWSSWISNWMFTVNIWIACYKTNEIFLMWDRFPNNLSSPMSHQGDKDLCCGKPLPYSVFIVCVLDIWSSWISNWMFTVNIWIACYKTNEIFLMWDRFPNNLSSPMSHQGDKDLCCGKPLPYSVFIVCVLDIWSSWISNWMFTVNIWIACYKTNEIFLMCDRFPNNLSSPMSHQGDKDLCCGKPLLYSVFIVCVLDIWSSWICRRPGGRLNIKMSYYQYRDPHVWDKSRDCLIFNMGIPYLGKIVFILRWGPYDKNVCNVTGWCATWAQSQYKDHLSQVWGFPC